MVEKPIAIRKPKKVETWNICKKKLWNLEVTVWFTEKMCTQNSRFGVRLLHVIFQSPGLCQSSLINHHNLPWNDKPSNPKFSRLTVKWWKFGTWLMIFKATHLQFGRSQSACCSAPRISRRMLEPHCSSVSSADALARERFLVEICLLGLPWFATTKKMAVVVGNLEKSWGKYEGNVLEKLFYLFCRYIWWENPWSSSLPSSFLDLSGCAWSIFLQNDVNLLV